MADAGRTVRRGIALSWRWCRCAAAVLAAASSASPPRPRHRPPGLVPQPCHPGPHQDGLQLGRVPWRGRGEERLQPDAARLRPGGRLRRHHAPGRRAPRQQARAGQEPAAAQADRSRAAHGRQEVRGPARPNTACSPVDGVGDAGAARRPRRELVALDVTPGDATLRRARSTPLHGAGAVLRRRDRGRHALGAVCVGRRDRRAGGRPGPGHA